ncbi:MAG: sensor histidine kinase, partial [Spirochaetaceae bacterium]|nr:sensor histidine kinase [Spirochaetaceae bacterium]
REVHDEIGQSLTVLHLQTYWLSSHPEAGADQRRSRIHEMQGVIGHAMAAVKALSTRLRPVALDALAFDETLRWYMDSFERRSGIRAEFVPTDPPPRIEGELATMLFRVLQEALTNVIRHSGAKRVVVRLCAAEGEFRMEVEDDGVGIAPGRAEAEDSFGIIGMRERCAMAGGSLEIGNRPEGGTALRLRVPQAKGA